MSTLTPLVGYIHYPELKYISGDPCLKIGITSLSAQPDNFDNFPSMFGLTGKAASPGLYEIISILGRDETLRRLNNAIEFATKNAA